MKLGVLGALDMPMMGQQIAALLAEGLVLSGIILDAAGTKAKDIAIHEERTAGRMPTIPLAHFESERLPCYFVSSHNSWAAVDLVMRLGFDLLVSAGTPRILKAPLLEASSFGVVNVHPGILPAFRGACCVEWAVWHDAPVGNTVHLMTEGVDEGPIIAVEETPIAKADTYVDVRVKVYEAGHRLMARAAKSIAEGRVARSDLLPQGDGTFFRPMEAEKIELVKVKLAAGRYRYQC